MEDFPHFTELELKFLASVIFKLYKRIFNEYIQSPEQFPMNL